MFSQAKRVAIVLVAFFAALFICCGSKYGKATSDPATIKLRDMLYEKFSDGGNVGMFVGNRGQVNVLLLNSRMSTAASEAQRERAKQIAKFMVESKLLANGDCNIVVWYLSTTKIWFFTFTSRKSYSFKANELKS